MKGRDGRRIMGRIGYNGYLVALSGAILMYLLAACVAPGPVQTESVTVGAEDAASVHVDVDMGAGRLEVWGGGEGLMEADFRYNVDSCKPAVEYSVSEGRGQLSVPTASGRRIMGGGGRCEWTLRFTEDLPLEMSLDLGAGEAELDLGDLFLTRLDVELGAGRVLVDLTGDWREGFRGRIEGGVGQCIVRLPAETGVRAEVSQGIGSVVTRGLVQEGNAWINQAYGESGITLELEVETGVGELRLVVEE